MAEGAFTKVSGVASQGLTAAGTAIKVRPGPWRMQGL
jgi:hypothetical protein